MNKKALTLIELMIVVAILGICLVFSYYDEYPDYYRKSESKLLEQQEIFRFRNTLNTFLKNSTRILNLSDKEIVFDNFRFSIAENGSKVIINGKTFIFNNFSFNDFERFDDDVVLCRVKNGMNNYNILLMPSLKKSTSIKINDNVDENITETQIKINDGTNNEK